MNAERRVANAYGIIIAIFFWTIFLLGSDYQRYITFLASLEIHSRRVGVLIVQISYLILIVATGKTLSGSEKIKILKENLLRCFIISSAFISLPFLFEFVRRVEPQDWGFISGVTMYASWLYPPLLITAAAMSINKEALSRETSKSNFHIALFCLVAAEICLITSTFLKGVGRLKWNDPYTLDISDILPQALFLISSCFFMGSVGPGRLIEQKEKIKPYRRVFIFLLSLLIGIPISLVAFMNAQGILILISLQEVAGLD